MNWIRLSINRAARSSTTEGDFYFRDEGGEYDGELPLDTTDATIQSHPARLFSQDNDSVLAPALLHQTLYDDIDLGDIDGDGDLDIYISDRDAPGFSNVNDNPRQNLLLVNLGGIQGGSEGWFRAQAHGDLLDVTHSSALMDIDADGDLDIVNTIECVLDMANICSTDPTSGGLKIYENQSIANDTLGPSFPLEFVDVTDVVIDPSGEGVPQGTTALASLDLNADGLPDLVTASPYDSSRGRLLVMGGDGVFVVQQLHLGDAAYNLAVGDLNRDGRLDLVTAAVTETMAELESDGCADGDRCWPHIFLNQGDGTLSNAGTFVDSSPWFDPDAAALVGQDDTVADYEVTGQFGALSVELADLDGDGVLDYYFSMGETQELPDLGDRNPKSDEDRIYLGALQCP